ncbi:hypothetical protein KIPB_004401 [Kipferlia bialata]|uniref:Uncharacterized protein n=1 Tax=Kipferlia bialata TaxID=797122 RepID=A0A9K3CWX7_9EUKA|nr:hypothetical protein KIPB_004401 [Kipferlia bialata]|eukprot:g4401.t1
MRPRVTPGSNQFSFGQTAAQGVSGPGNPPCFTPTGPVTAFGAQHATQVSQRPMAHPADPMSLFGSPAITPQPVASEPALFTDIKSHGNAATKAPSYQRWVEGGPGESLSFSVQDNQLVTHVFSHQDQQQPTSLLESRQIPSRLQAPRGVCVTVQPLAIARVGGCVYLYGKRLRSGDPVTVPFGSKAGTEELNILPLDTLEWKTVRPEDRTADPDRDGMEPKDTAGMGVCLDGKFLVFGSTGHCAERHGARDEEDQGGREIMRLYDPATGTFDTLDHQCPRGIMHEDPMYRACVVVHGVLYVFARYHAFSFTLSDGWTDLHVSFPAHVTASYSAVHVKAFDRLIVLWNRDSMILYDTISGDVAHRLNPTWLFPLKPGTLRGHLDLSIESSTDDTRVTMHRHNKTHDAAIHPDLVYPNSAMGYARVEDWDDPEAFRQRTALLEEHSARQRASVPLTRILGGRHGRAVGLAAFGNPTPPNPTTQPGFGFGTGANAPRHTAEDNGWPRFSFG